MKKLSALLLCVMLLCACADQYNIKGTSSVSALDGNKLYLKVMKGDDLVAIDSCEVVHGEFHFAGLLDTVVMAYIFTGDKDLLPVVVDKGEVTVSIDQPTMRIGGTPLNDSLFVFLQRHTQIQSNMMELSRRESRMLLDGIDEGLIHEQISREAAILAKQEDSLVTHFICDNFDTPLGPGIFMMLTSAYPYPILTPQIEEIMSKATPRFQQDAYVKEYIRMAEDNERKMLEDVATPDAP